MSEVTPARDTGTWRKEAAVVPWLVSGGEAHSPCSLLGRSLPPPTYAQKTLLGNGVGGRGQGGNRGKAGDLSKLSPGFLTKQRSEYPLIYNL